MKYKIQITEEQAREMWGCGYSDEELEDTISRWKQKGYIKKDPVEEAEEIVLKHIKFCDVGSEYFMDFVKIKEVIKCLKQQLKDKEDEHN